MVRFARSDGEANSIAIRIARAAADKDHIAVCGYHGWHDWYLSANVGDEKSLDDHLFPGLSTNGVSDSLRGLTHPFSFYDLDELSKINDDFPIGAVKMEVMRSHPPKEGFLESVRELCNKNGIVLIFVECTSGFRETHSGLYKKFGVEPDIAFYGKTLGNRYAVSAVVGRQEVMQSAQETFISSTFWTERISSTAALRTLEVMDVPTTMAAYNSYGKKGSKPLG